MTVLPNVAKEEGLDEAAVETVTTASKSLMDQFMKIHHGFHGAEEAEASAYDAVAEEMTKAMAELGSIVKPATDRQQLP